MRTRCNILSAQQWGEPFSGCFQKVDSHPELVSGSVRGEKPVKARGKRQVKARSEILKQVQDDIRTAFIRHSYGIRTAFVRHLHGIQKYQHNGANTHNVILNLFQELSAEKDKKGSRKKTRKARSEMLKQVQHDIRTAFIRHLHGIQKYQHNGVNTHNVILTIPHSKK